MSYLPINNRPPSSFITALSVESVAIELLTVSNQGISSFSSANWPSANQAVFIPFTLRGKIVTSSLFCINGSANSGNIDIGIYTSDGTKIISTGSTVSAGTQTMQSVGITPLTLGPGVYYMALACSSATNNVRQVAALNATRQKAVGIFQQATAFPLPATATFATYTTVQTFLYGLTAI